MAHEGADYLQDAYEYWEGGKPLEAGRIIFDRLANAARPAWAAKILRLVLEWSGLRLQEIDRLLYIADYRDEWERAHDAFDAIRDATLDMEKCQVRQDRQELVLNQLYLAENVAKVVYNASDPPDEFDKDSGWWVAVCLRAIVERSGDACLAKSAWEALTT